MSKTIDEAPVIETTEKAPVGKDAFTAARASIAAQSTDQDRTEEPAKDDDDTSKETPAETSAEVTDQPSEVTDEPSDTLLPPEEVEKLTGKAKAQYDRMNKAFTTKTQALAATRKEMEQWTGVIEGLKSNPDAVIEQLAKQRGLTISKPQEAAIESQAADALAQLPEEWQTFLKPIFEQYGKTILASVDGKLKPIEQAHQQIISEATAAETKATIEAFDSKYPGWKKHEAKMTELGGKFIPTAGAMTDFEYMETLYKLATADMKKVDQLKETVKQINKSAASVEPNAPGVSDVRVEQTRPANWTSMTDKERMRAAYDAAKNGVVWK